MSNKTKRVIKGVVMFIISAVALSIVIFNNSVQAFGNFLLAIGGALN